MKKILLMAVVAFGMLATACSKDEVAQPVAEKSTVTFSVAAPELATRAEHGDGTLAKDLTYAVYNRADGAKLFDGTATMNAELKATVEIPFVNGMTYDVLFWAESENSPYLVNWTAKTVGYDPAVTLVSNSKDYDAFYYFLTGDELPEITGPVTKTVELKRPFAQLNIATNDTADAYESGLVVENVAVEVTNAYTQFSLVSGNGVDNTNTGVTFASAPKQGGKILTDYDLLAVNYLFTGGEKQLVNVKFTYTDSEAKGGNAGHTAEYNSVPVQRNYRTNIIGSLLTSDGKFNIEIKPGFDGEPGHKYEVISVATAAELQNALDNSAVGEITLEDDIDLSEILTIGVPTRAETEAVVRNLTIDGNGKTLKSSAARAINVSGVDGVTIKNLTIECSGERAINIIQNATNVKIENVTATAANYTVNVASSAPEAVVDIKNSTLTGLCTVNVAAAGAEVTVDGCTVNCNDNNTTVGEAYAAISLNKEAENATITVTNTTINVAEDSDSKPARNSAAGGTITIDGSTEGVIVMVAAITYEGSPYYYSFETFEEAVEFAKEGDVITLLRDITLTESLNITKDLIIDGNGKTLSVSQQYAIVACPNAAGEDKRIDVELKNINIDAERTGNNGYVIAAGNANLTLGEGVVIDAEGYSCVVEASVNDALTNPSLVTIDGANLSLVTPDAPNGTVIGAGFGSTIEVKSGVLNGSACNYAVSAYPSGGTVNIRGGEIIGALIVYDATKPTEINVYNGTFSTDPSAYVAAGYMAVDNGNGTWTVKNYQAELQEALNNGGDVTLAADLKVSEALVIPEGVTVTLDLNGKTLSGAIAKADGPILKNEGTLTVKNGTISSTAKNGGSAIQNNAGAELTINDVTIYGAEFEAPGWPSYGINNYGTLTINDAAITTYHGAVATGGDGVTVINGATVDVGNSTETNQTSWALYVYDNGQLTVNGGTFANTKNEYGQVYGGGYICAISTNQTIINGGTFDKTEGDNNGSGFYYNNKNLVIKGGTFDANPSAYVAAGYQVVDNSNGTWSVKAE